MAVHSRLSGSNGSASQLPRDQPSPPAYPRLPWSRHGGALLGGVLVCVALLLSMQCSRWAPTWAAAGSGHAVGRFGRGSGGSGGDRGAASGSGGGSRAAARLNSSTAFVDMTDHPFCRYLRTGASNVHHEVGWGHFGDLCRRDHPKKFLALADSLCYSCITGEYVCGDKAPTIQFHMYMDRLHPKLWRRNLVGLQSYLMTQDLDRSHMTLWTHNVSVMVTDKTAAFFDEWRDHITVKAFDYEAEIKGTPFEGDPFLGNLTTLKKAMFAPATFTDVVRLLILHNYGGAWVDYDLIFFRDLTNILAVSYQLSLRWTNNNFMFYHRGSALITRMLRLAQRMPVNHPKFKEEIIGKLCKPVGYYQSDALLYGFTDVYNMCLLRLALKTNNTLGQDVGPDGLLVDVPQSWFDDWVRCYEKRSAVDDKEWRDICATFLAMHTHFFKDTKVVPQSPMGRMFEVIDGWWGACNNTRCMPRRGANILAFDIDAAGDPDNLTLAPPP
ncbi:MAG: hypothetical protein J3K34DRAFT_425270 [Monoraphidium minutum]|nr:MAG: hypothetical protein J3K34DRAFT_425270 [Monoraphidium minutum]